MPVTIDKPTLTDEAAVRIAEAAVAEARRLGVPQVVAILDDSGILKALRRMDGAPVVSVSVAQDKAYTALLGIASDALFEAVQGDAALRTGLPTVPRLTLIGGGKPIRVGGALVGAIGVGGGTVEQDIACADAGLREV